MILARVATWLGTRTSRSHISDWQRPVYVDAVASWDDSPSTRQHVWDLFLNAPPPLGYDPAISFIAPDHPNFGVLRIVPTKITLATIGGDPWQRIWRRSDG